MKYVQEETGDGAYKVSQIEKHLDAMKEDSYYHAQIVGAEGKPINLDKCALELLKKYFPGEEITAVARRIATCAALATLTNKEGV